MKAINNLVCHKTPLTVSQLEAPISNMNLELVNSVKAGRTITGTDLLVFLFTNNCLVNIPSHYKGSGPKNTTEGQTVTSSKNRHGVLDALISNKNLPSMGIRIKDQQVENDDGSRGGHRVFHILDYLGRFQSSFQDLEFDVPDKYKADLESIMRNGKLHISTLLTNDMANMLFTTDYLKAKLAVMRAGHTMSHNTAECKRMIVEGLQVPEEDQPGGWGDSSSDKTGMIKRPFDTNVFDVYVEFPDGYEDGCVSGPQCEQPKNKFGNPIKAAIKAAYPTYDVTVENYGKLREETKILRRLREQLQFFVRCIENAWFLQGSKRYDRLPGFSNSWEDTKIVSTDWKKLDVSHLVDVDYKIFLYQRTGSKEEWVNPKVYPEA